LIQGIWVPESEIAEAGVLDDPRVNEAMDSDTRRTIEFLTGDTDPATDVSAWLAGIVIGVEWDPALVAATDLRGPRRASGEYIVGAGEASPTELWIAGRLDAAAAALARAGVAAPLSFINWTPTDPIDHTRYPNTATIDANHVMATEAWPAGVFATYHAYPYAPAELLRQEPGIADFRNGEHVDPYAGYLAALDAHHPGLPVVIGEVGVPGGWAPAGADFGIRTYGGHLEATQMQANAELVDLVADMGLSGAWVFEWTDEWFKPTWNMADLDPVAERRANWHNLLSVEQHFGILAVEATPAAILDGTVDDWAASDLLVENGPLEVSARSDASALYLMAQGTIDDMVEFRIDTDAALRHSQDPIETGSEVSIRAGVDQVTVVERSGYHTGDDSLIGEPGGTGVWEPFAILTSLGSELRPPGTWEVSSLRRSAADGTGTVPHEEAGWARTRNVIEVRIPWVMLGMADPSGALALRFGSDGFTTSPLVRLGVHLVVGDAAVSGEYELRRWTEPLYQERRKNGAGALSAALCRTSFIR
jgi:hypothetical protein